MKLNTHNDAIITKLKDIIAFTQNQMPDPLCFDTEPCESHKQMVKMYEDAVKVILLQEMVFNLKQGKNIKQLHRAKLNHYRNDILSGNEKTKAIAAFEMSIIRDIMTTINVLTETQNENADYTENHSNANRVV